MTRKAPFTADDVKPEQIIVHINVDHWMPTDPPRPAPSVLTAQEAALYLRLSGTPKQVQRTVDSYRLRGILRGFRVGRNIRYSLASINEFIASRDKGKA